MESLITPSEAARRIGVSLDTVYAWVRRADAPLPSIQVGKSGKHTKVVASEIEPWLVAEAARKATKK